MLQRLFWLFQCSKNPQWLVTKGSNLDRIVNWMQKETYIKSPKNMIFENSYLILIYTHFFKFQHPYLRLIVCYFVILCNFLVFAEDPVSHSKRGEQKTFLSLTFSSSQFYTLLQMYMKVVSKVPRNFNYIYHSFILLYNHVLS